MNVYRGRVDRLEDRMMRRRCGTCYGAASAIVFVPDGDDPDALKFNPAVCEECGTTLRSVRQIVGISEEEMFGPLESAG